MTQMFKQLRGNAICSFNNSEAVLASQIHLLPVHFPPNDNSIAVEKMSIMIDRLTRVRLGLLYNLELPSLNESGRSHYET